MGLPGTIGPMLLMKFLKLSTLRTIHLHNTNKFGNGILQMNCTDYTSVDYPM